MSTEGVLLATQAPSATRGGPGSPPRAGSDPAPPRAPGRASSLGLPREQTPRPRATDDDEVHVSYYWRSTIDYTTMR